MVETIVMIHGMWVDASRLTCPAPVVASAEDRITPAAVSRKVARKYAAVSTYKEFAGQAHGVIGAPGNRSRRMFRPGSKTHRVGVDSKPAQQWPGAPGRSRAAGKKHGQVGRLTFEDDVKAPTARQPYCNLSNGFGRGGHAT